MMSSPPPTTAQTSSISPSVLNHHQYGAGGEPEEPAVTSSYLSTSSKTSREILGMKVTDVGPVHGIVRIDQQHYSSSSSHHHYTSGNIISRGEGTTNNNGTNIDAISNGPPSRIISTSFEKRSPTTAGASQVFSPSLCTARGGTLSATTGETKNHHHYRRETHRSNDDSSGQRSDSDATPTSTTTSGGSSSTTSQQQEFSHRGREVATPDLLVKELLLHKRLAEVAKIVQEAEERRRQAIEESEQNSRLTVLQGRKGGINCLGTAGGPTTASPGVRFTDPTNSAGDPLTRPDGPHTLATRRGSPMISPNDSFRANVTNGSFAYYPSAAAFATSGAGGGSVGNSSFTSLPNASFGSTGGSSGGTSSRRRGISPCFMWVARLCCVLILLVTMMALVLPQRVAYFQNAPYDQDPILLYLYEIEVPYPGGRNFSYGVRNSIFTPSQAFLDWVPPARSNSVENSRKLQNQRMTFPDIGFSPELDDFGQVQVSCGSSLVLVSLALLFQVVGTGCYPCHWHKVFPLCHLTSACILVIDLFVFHFTMNNAGSESILFKDERSGYGSGFWCILAAAIMGLIFPGIAFGLYGSTYDQWSRSPREVIRKEMMGLDRFLINVEKCLRREKDDESSSTGGDENDNDSSAAVTTASGRGELKSNASFTSSSLVSPFPTYEPHAKPKSPILKASSSAAAAAGVTVVPQSMLLPPAATATNQFSALDTPLLRVQAPSEQDEGASPDSSLASPPSSSGATAAFTRQNSSGSITARSVGRDDRQQHDRTPSLTSPMNPLSSNSSFNNGSILAMLQQQPNSSGHSFFA